MSVSLTFGTAMDEMKEHFNAGWIDGIANGLADRPAIVFTEADSKQ